jgi:hypothetical protein
MRVSAFWATTSAPALVLLGLLQAAVAHASRHANDPNHGSVTIAPPDVCEFRTINYITHTLPQQCFRTSWTGPTPTTAPATAADDSSTVRPAPAPAEASATDVPAASQENAAGAQDQRHDDGNEELAATSFMSFEEWKEMMLRKSGQDPAHIKAHRPRERETKDRDAPHTDSDSFGEEGEISLDFDALAEKVSEITSSAGQAVPQSTQQPKDEPVLYDDGKTQYYRSKDAGKTCKERFSYASFDAGATILKTSPGAKNAKAILVENKDSYMLLECRAKNKFVIVELSDDILVDTVVLANFEFFSSMIRKFRVSVSDRYPVKMDKWVHLGTFEARNSRDIQAFLIEHPQIYTKYIRIEFLSHWGNEFYCPISLLRVHGTRMLDTWKEPAHDDEPEQIEGAAPEPANETHQVAEPPSTEKPAVAQEEPVNYAVTETGLSPWQPMFPTNLSLDICELYGSATTDPTSIDASSGEPPKQPGGAPEAAAARPSAGSGSEDSGRSGSSSDQTSHEVPVHGQPGGTSGHAASAPPHSGVNATAAHTGQRHSDVKHHAGDNTTATTTSRNKTTTTASSATASPTVQESFFKTVSKRLQLLESNTSLSLQYIEQQSRFLQEVLSKLERKQITRVDTFLDALNKTVLSELHSVRTQYDQIWQSTVIALETQREQSQREIVALTSRLNVLADEVVFQKRMAILQSVLLLACLVLVIFSRGGLGAIDNASFSFPPATTSYRRYGGYGYGHARSDSGASSPRDPRLQQQQSSSSLAASALPRHLYAAGSSTSYKDKSLPLTPPSEYSRESTPAAATSRHRTRSPEASSLYEGMDGGEADTPPQRRRRWRSTTPGSVGAEEVMSPRSRVQSPLSYVSSPGPDDGEEEEEEEEEGVEMEEEEEGVVPSVEVDGDEDGDEEKEEELAQSPIRVRKRQQQQQQRPSSSPSPSPSLRTQPSQQELLQKPLPALPQDPS